MLNHTSLLGAAGVVVATAACVASSNAPSAKISNEAAPPQNVNVTRLYDETCGKCHGMAGEGGGGGTRSLISEEKFDQKHDKAFFDAIKNGVPDSGMESFANFGEAQIWALVVHIRELQAKGLRAKNGSPKASNGLFTSKHHAYRVETVIEADQGLRTPWAIDWLPDGKMLVTNRPGTMSIVSAGKVTGTVSGLPASAEIGQGGLMDVAVHPDYSKTGWIYLSFTDPAGAGGRGGMTKVVRGKLEWNGPNANWTSQSTVFQCPPEAYNSSGVHFGSRIVFDGKGQVFFSIGERGNGTLAQDLTKPNGKIYRVNEDGSIPSDNPFADATSKGKGYLGAIWSYGHRNPQGLVQDLEGNLWDTEHGPRGGDEVNRIEKAGNYGWPIIAFSINYNDTPMSTPWPKAGQNFKLPAARWLPSVGACGLDVVKGAAFPKWKGDLVAGGLSGANVDRFRMKGGQLVEREELLHGMGRVREVSVGPDGFVYVALNQPDKVIRIRP